MYCVKNYIVKVCTSTYTTHCIYISDGNNIVDNTLLYNFKDEDIFRVIENVTILKIWTQTRHIKDYIPMYIIVGIETERTEIGESKSRC